MHFRNLVEGTHTPQYLAFTGVHQQSLDEINRIHEKYKVDNYIQQERRDFDCDLLVGVVHEFTTCEFTCMFEQNLLCS
jgi:hypothetical protein